jgi:CheY-like chemotaxis protein
MTSETDTTILIVDDAPESLSVLRKLLWSKYRVLAAASGAGGLRVWRATFNSV